MRALETEAQTMRWRRERASNSNYSGRLSVSGWSRPPVASI